VAMDRRWQFAPGCMESHRPGAIDGTRVHDIEPDLVLEDLFDMAADVPPAVQ
jgi:hypothetical protein